MRDLKGKKILFISPRYFNLHTEIMESLRKRGAEVEFYDERPANTFLVKAAIRINRNLIGWYIDRYHRDIIARTAGRKFDYIFFIKGESFGYDTLKELFDSHPEAKTVVYHYDSMINNPNALRLLPLFDARYSFDRRDCEQLDVDFLPLFYFDEYADIPDVGESHAHDLLFVGTAHGDRYRIISTIAEQFEKLGKTCFTYFYFQDKLMFYKYYLQHKEIRNIEKEKVNYESIDKKRLLDLYSNSRLIVDVCNPKQTGLTLRCMETLGSRRKLITTNPDIVNYDFYNPANIQVIDPANPVVDPEFLNHPFEPVEEEIFKKYSLSSWLNTIFS